MGLIIFSAVVLIQATRGRCCRVGQVGILMVCNSLLNPPRTDRVRSRLQEKPGTDSWFQSMQMAINWWQTSLADEPSEVGGTDRGASPYEFLSAALVSCTIMTLHMYARRKKWPLESVVAQVSHGKIHAEDCENCQSTTGKIDRFDRIVTINGDLDAQQRQRLLEIADRCPVHRTLHEEVEIRTRLAD
jgi:putative redox protein